MINRFKQLSGFTLAETMVTFFIIGVVAACTIAITKMHMNYAQEVMSYSAFTNLKTIVSELVAEGCNSSDLSLCDTPKSLPLKGHVASFTDYKEAGFCDRVINMVNTVGDTTCDPITTTIPSGTTNFTGLTPNFISNSGARYYNLGEIASLSLAAPSGYLNSEFDYECDQHTGKPWLVTPAIGDDCYVDDEDYTTPRLLTKAEFLSLIPLRPSLDSAGFIYWTSTPCTDTTPGYIMYQGSNGSGTPIEGCRNGVTYYGLHMYFVSPLDFYIAYVDIDGAKGKSRLNEDVIPFRIYTTGEITIPADSLAANSTKYFSTSIRFNTNQWLTKGVTYREAACVSGAVTSATYCGAQTINSVSYPAYTRDTTNCPEVDNTCTVVVNKP